MSDIQPETVASLLTAAGTIGAAAVGVIRKLKDLPSESGQRALRDDILRLEGKVDATREDVAELRSEVDGLKKDP